VADASTESEPVRREWWRTVLSVPLAFVLLVPGAVMGLFILLTQEDLEAADVFFPGLATLIASIVAFFAATYGPPLILGRGADHRTARLVFAGLSVLATAAGAFDYLGHASGPTRELLGPPTRLLAINVGLGIAGALVGGLWGTWEVTRSPETRRRNRPRNPPARR
jgi:hypothetical protein